MRIQLQLDEVDSMTEKATTERDVNLELFERLPMPIVVTNGAGAIERANARARELLGSSQTLVRHPLPLLVGSSGSRTIRNVLLDVGAKGRVKVPLASERGRFSLEAILLAGSRVLWIFGPPDQTQLERDLFDAKDLLRDERSAKAELERRDRAKDRFLAVLSHDLRAGIHSVLGWADMMRAEALDRRARESALSHIQRAAQMQLDLIEGLLDVSRLAVNQLRLEVVPLELGTLVKRVHARLAARASEHGIDVVIEDATAGNAQVFGDRERIEQIVTNLLTNALKNARERVVVTITREAANVSICVSDDGAGIEPKLLPDIFDSLTRSTREPLARDGLGLGLFIVKKLAEIHRGTVEAHSDGIGLGSRFVVRLPARTPGDAPSTSALGTGKELDGLRVLIVEDDMDCRELYSTILHENGADVAAASDVATAVEMFASETPDVVVTDIGLETADGYALLAMLQGMKRDVRAIAVSGYTSEREKARARDAGFAEYLPKPFTPEALIAAVRLVSLE